MSTAVPTVDYEDLSSNLLKASYHGDVRAVADLLNDSETQVDAVTPTTGRNALHIACSEGHVDIVDEAHCFPLSNQQPLRQPGLEGWSDSFIDEIVYQLEMVYTDPDDAQQRGRAAAAFIRERFSWEHAIKHLSSILRDFERQQQEGSNAIDGTI